MMNMPWRGMLPTPGTITQPDRQQMALMYSGISPAADDDAHVHYISGSTDATDLQDYTFSINLGTVSAHRKNVVTIVSRDNSTTAQILSVEIDNNNMTAVRNERLNGAANTTIAAIFEIESGTGSALDGVTTATLEVHFDQTVLRCRADWYYIEQAGNVFDHEAATSAASPTSMGVNLDVPAEGVAIGVIGTAATGVNWNGFLTEDVDVVTEAGLVASSASKDFASAQAPLAISVTIATPGVAAERVLVAASWGKYGAAPGAGTMINQGHMLKIGRMMGRGT